MNKEDKIRRLTWKFFWEQKAEELGEVMKSILFGYCITGWFFGLLFTILAFEDGYEIIYNGNWWAFIPLGLWVILICIKLVDLFIEWILQNWKKAERRAKDQAERAIKINKETKKNG